MTALLLIDKPSGSVSAVDVGAAVELGDSATAEVVVTDSGSTLVVKDGP